MALSDYKMTDANISTEGVVAAPDTMTGTPAENKAVFDRLVREIVKEKLNAVIDAIAAAGGAGEVGATAPDGMTGATVQALLTELKALIDTDGTTLSTHAARVDNPHAVTKAQVGLGNADNTADANKPVSTAQQTAINLKVDKVSGKGLSANDFTAELLAKLNGIAAGAQANVIEILKRNGVALTITNKGVDITVPTKTSDLNNDSGYITDANVLTKTNTTEYTPTADYQPATKKYADNIAAQAGAVTSVFGRAGAVVAASGDYTPAQVGAEPSGAVSTHNSAADAHSDLFAAKADASALTTHTGNTSNPHSVTAAQVGARPDTWTPTAAEVGAVATPDEATALPTSGTALTANTVYTVPNTALVGTYQFSPPASGWAHGTFYTGTTVTITFASGTYLGEAPSFNASSQYEFDVNNGVWAFAEVVSA